MTRLLKIIYIGALLPLLTGSGIFFYWYYKRTWYADHADIELFAFFTILGFILFAVTSIILCIIFIYKNRTDWAKTVVPLLIIGLTVPAIGLYEELHYTLSDKAFLRIINDTDDLKIKRIWSDNFELTHLEKKGCDFVSSYYPVYIYDWKQPYSGIWYHYDINPVSIDLKTANDSISTFQLGTFSKGACRTIRLTEIVNEN